MDITVLDKTLTPIAVIDNYISFIWTERYDECGDFELYMAMDPSLLDIFQMDYLLTIKDSDRAMIIEDINIDSNIEDGDRLTITGHSLEFILNRRIIPEVRNYENYHIYDSSSSYVHTNTIVPRLLAENICRIMSGPNSYTEPSDIRRKISNFECVVPTDDRIKNLTATVQYEAGTSLYDAIKSLCQDAKIGFKIVLDNDKFLFNLFMGEDRSYEQTVNDYVVFSPEFDNIISSNYVNSQSTYANVAWVGGEGQGKDRVVVLYPSASSTQAEGFARKEVFINESGISSKKEDGTTMSSSAYQSLLRDQGKAELNSNYVQKTGFEGEVDATRLFAYGEDFFLGDIVQVADAYGNSGTCYVSEVIISDDDSGFSIYPTFKNIDEDEE